MATRKAPKRKAPIVGATRKPSDLEAKDVIAETISAHDAGILLTISARHVAVLAQQGYFPAGVAGRYQTVPLVQGYVRYLRELNKESKHSAHENRVRDARAHHFEVRTAAEMRRLIDIDEAEAVQDELTSALRLGMVGLGASITRDLDLRRKIDGAVEGVFSRVHAWLVKARTTLREGGESVAPDAPAEPG